MPATMLVKTTPAAKVKTPPAAKVKTPPAVKMPPTTERIVYLSPEEYQLGFQTRMVEDLDVDLKVRRLALSMYDNRQTVPAVVTEGEEGELPTLDAGRHRHLAVLMIREGFTLPKDDMGFERDIQDAEFKLMAVLKPSASEYQRILSGILENIHEPVTDVQEAKMHDLLRTKFRKQEQEIAAIYGYSNDNRVRNLRNLLECDPAVLAQVHEGHMSVTAALQTTGLSSAKVAEVVAKAVSGVVTARDVAEMRDESGKAPATPAPTAPPRNSAALKKFIMENILSAEDKDSFSEPVIALAKAMLTYIAGKGGDQALLNKWEALK